MKQSLSRDVVRFQKIAGILNESFESMGEATTRKRVMYDDIPFNIYGSYPDIKSALQAVKQYLDSGTGQITFDHWYKHEGEFLPQTGPVLFLVGPKEKPGQQPPLLVSTDDESLEM